MRALLLASSLLLAPAAAQTIWTVDAGGGGDFADLQVAIDAAAPGDVLRILPGAYATAVTTKALTFLGDGVPAPSVSSLAVLGAPWFVASNLDVPRLRVSGVLERSLIERCTVGGGDPWIASSAFIVDDAADLIVERSTVVADRHPSIGFGYTGLRIGETSRVQVVACDVSGGDGVAVAQQGTSGAGGHGIRVRGDSRLLLVASDVRGGAGETLVLSGGPPIAGVGGHAVQLADPTHAVFADVRGGPADVLAGGRQDAATSGAGDGLALAVDCASGSFAWFDGVALAGATSACVAPHAAPMPYLVRGGAGGPGGVHEFAVHAPVGSVAVVALALAPSALELPLLVQSTPLWIDLASAVLLHPVALAAPTAVLALLQPTDPALVGCRIHAQAFQVLAGGGLRGTNAVVLLLGA